MTTIAGYSNLEVIGRGGFAVVYRADQESVGRQVAIKQLLDPTPDDDLIRRFQRESRAVGALSWHPHIAAVVDAGKTAAGQAYIVFEFLSGGSLEDRIAHGPMPWNDAVSSMIQVADAVEAAHRAEVLHRDIKPANVLLDRLGVAKLGDFGIASMQDGTKTETGMLATTVAHAAPELFEGRPASVATDVYALGSTLHNLVTGAPPFNPAGNERLVATMGRILTEPPPRPDPTIVPIQVADVIAHALAKQPEYRPRSAAEFGHALQQSQRELGVSVTAMPVSDGQRSAQAAVRAVQPQSPALAPSVVHHDALPPASIPSSAHGSAAVTPLPSLTAGPRKPFSRTIAALTTVAVLLAAGLGGLVLYNARSTDGPLVVTAGGARVRSFDAFDLTEQDPPFSGDRALDGDENTYWKIVPNDAEQLGIIGTTFRIDLTEEQRIVSVGISNGTLNDLGRVSSLRWATSNEDLSSGSNAVDQAVPDQPSMHTTPYSVTTDVLIVVISGVHDEQARDAGIAEILIEVEPSE